MLDCQLVLPCRDEAPALRLLLPRVPRGLGVVVVDNGSTDETAAVAARAGALVVDEPRPGYGAAVDAGVRAATATFVAVMDGDGSFDPADVLPLLALVRDGEADLAMGRRDRTTGMRPPWTARLGNALVLATVRRRTGVALDDLGPLRVARRADLLALGIEDRRFGYPVELVDRAARAGWRIVERDVAYHPRTPGTRSKVSGSVSGTFRAGRDFLRVLATTRRGER
ncbi:glycosyltransferase family 2 protein [Nocardioides carbamazepini]|uniref:glycosyltransferase family 2 protein n=1 Tax=Nocardioides carbamazepini TaxID=2854259 RepID=UPI002149F06A|nr:glycosyltransferase family 2 protein [Nocardioides carbamazepini]MCR1783970.1 glycosyltransferase family 2 protein [Nocardioides carbamazepini]